MSKASFLEHVVMEGRVDRAAGIIRGVSILGRTSVNGREYSDTAMRDAARLYEGARVRINHPDRRNPYRERSLSEEFGTLKNVRLEGSRVKGDLHFVKSHPDAEWILERAERFPDKLGLSHNADGKSSRRGGREVVESLSRVVSVDLVNEPATTGGLFESAGGGAPETYEELREEFLAEFRGHTPRVVRRPMTFDERLSEAAFGFVSSQQVLDDLVAAFKKLTPRDVAALDKAYDKAVLAITDGSNINEEIEKAIDQLNMAYDKLRGELERRLVFESVCREVDRKKGRDYPASIKEFVAALK